MNDLDLTVNINGVVYRGNSFSGAWSQPDGVSDHVNNVESVWIQPGAFGPLQIEVMATSLTAESMGLGARVGA